MTCVDLCHQMESIHRQNDTCVDLCHQMESTQSQYHRLSDLFEEGIKSFKKKKIISVLLTYTINSCVMISRKKNYYNWILNCNRIIREREISQFQNDILAVSVMLLTCQTQKRLYSKKFI